MAQEDSETRQSRRDQERRMAGILHKIAADDVLIDAIVQAVSNERDLAQLRVNPRAHFHGQGSRIPDEVSVEFVEGPPPGVRFTLSGKGVRHSFEAHSGERGAEADPEERARFRRLESQVHRNFVSDALLDALDEADRDQKVLADLKADPRAYLQGKGISVADEVDVRVTEGSHCYWVC